MKNLILSLILLLAITSCADSKITDESMFEFDNAWYTTANFKEGTTQAELKDFVNTYANPNQTSFFYFYAPDVDASFFGKNKFSYDSFKRTIINDPAATYGFYKMPNDDTIYDDGIELIEMEYRMKAENP